MAVLVDSLALTQQLSTPVEMCLVHDIPGRLRFIVPDLPRDHRRAVALRAHLRRLEAVRAVKINLLTGSVLIEHNGLCASRDAIMLALENAGYRLTRQTSVQANEVRQHWPSKVAALSANAVIGWIVERAIFNALAAVA